MKYFLEETNIEIYLADTEPKWLFSLSFFPVAHCSILKENDARIPSHIKEMAKENKSIYSVHLTQFPCEVS